MKNNMASKYPFRVLVEVSATSKYQMALSLEGIAAAIKNGDLMEGKYISDTRIASYKIKVNKNAVVPPVK